MQNYRHCLEIEKGALGAILELLKNKVKEGSFVIANSGIVAETIQKNHGDILYNKGEKIFAVDIKSEEDDFYGNFFLETWSNRSRYTPGWMFTLKTNFLFYYFLKTGELYIINFQLLQKWAFHESRIYFYPEKSQKKTNQLNDTWGRCVPIADIKKEVGYQKYVLTESGWDEIKE